MTSPLWPILAYLATGSVASPTLPASNGQITPADWSITEPLDRDWGEQWISRLVSAPPGTRDKWMLAVVDEDGREVRSDFGVAEENPDGSVAKALAMVRVGLKPGQTREFRIIKRDPGERFSVGLLPEPGPEYSEWGVQYDFALISLWSGTKEFDPPAVIEDLRAPISRLEANKPSPRSMRVEFRLKGLPKVRTISAAHLPRTSIVDWREARYEFADGSEYICRHGTIPEEPVVIIHEDFRKLDAGELVLELSDPAGLTHGHGRGRLAPPGESKLTDGYAIDFSSEWTGRIQPFYAWWKDYGLWWAAYRPDGAYAGILPLKPSEWLNPSPNVIRIHTGPKNRVQAALPFHKGTRIWAIVLSRAGEALACTPGRANLMMRQAIRLGQNPLDRVKDMVLTWPRMDEVEYPHLLCRPADVPAIREKARSHPLFKRVLEQYPDAPEDPVGLYLATGDESIARRGIDELIRQLRKWVEETLDGGNYGESLCAIPFTRPLRTAALAFDILASSPTMTPAERNYCLRAFAFLAYCLYDENRWPARNQGFHRGNVNFHSDDYTCRAAVVTLLKGHPKQREWMDYVDREMRLEFDNCVFPGGAWCEAPNYQGFTMHYLIIAMRLMQLNGFADYAGEPRFRETMDYFFRIQTPFDVRAGCHMLPTVGDTTSSYHSQSLQNVFAWSAALLRDKDPAFAGRMMHAWKRGGSVLFGDHGLGFGQGWLQPLLLIDPGIPENPPTAPLPSERLPGYGALLRNSHGTERESYFLFKMGKADQHYDSDEGSFHWYALGRPISLDFGSMYQPSIEQPWLHSTLDFGRCRIWSQGELTAFTSLPGTDFCRGEVLVKSLQRVPDLPEQPLPPGVSGEIQWNKYAVKWRREILFAREPGYVVIRDDLSDSPDSLPTGWSVQVLASEVAVAGSRARCKGQAGVDLQVLVAEPAQAKLTVSKWGYRSEAAPAWTAPTPMPAVAETQLAFYTTAPANGDYLVAMVPFRPGEAEPRVSSVGQGAIEIETTDAKDTVFCTDRPGTWQAANLSFTGRVATVRRWANLTSICIIEGQLAEIGECQLRCTGPVSVSLASDSVAGASDGEARTLSVRSGTLPPTEAEAFIDGRKASSRHSADGTISLDLPAGLHRFAIRLRPANNR